MHRTTALAAAALALAAALAGCTPEPTPTPTPTPTVTPSTPAPTPTLSERDQNIADAKDTYLRFVAAYDEAAQAGFVDRDLTIAVFNLTAESVREAMVSTQASFEANGLTQTGASVVKSLEATQYLEGSAGAEMQRVFLRACLDPSQVDTISAGQSTEPAEQYTGPRNVYVQVQRQAGGYWLVAEIEAKPEEHC